MKTKFFISLLVVAMSVMFISCDRGPFSVFKPNEELFEYTCYDKGSYWVYEDSATHETDSIAVITKPEKAVSSDNRSGTASKVKTFKYKYNYVNNNKSISDTISFEPTIYGNMHSTGFYSNFPEDYYLFPRYPYGKTVRSAYALTYINLRNPVNDTNNMVYYPHHNKFYQSLEIGANRFNLVKRFVIKDNIKFGPRFDSVITYWAKNIGVIRCECYDSSGAAIMNLIRYDVKNVKKKELY